MCEEHPGNEKEEEMDKKGVSIYDCIEMFKQREQLEASDMWYCFKCAEHRQAWKEMALWTTPPIVVRGKFCFRFMGWWMGFSMYDGPESSPIIRNVMMMMMF